GRDSVVIYPPADTDFYTPADVPREDFYLVVSALAPYKRFDLAIAGCEKLGRKLVVIGSGQEAKKLKALAGPNTTFLGWQPDAVIEAVERFEKGAFDPAAARQNAEPFGLERYERELFGYVQMMIG